MERSKIETTREASNRLEYCGAAPVFRRLVSCRLLNEFRLSSAEFMMPLAMTANSIKAA